MYIQCSQRMCTVKYEYKSLFIVVFTKHMKSVCESGGLNHLFRLIIFSIHGDGKWYLKNCISFYWPKEIIVIGYNLVFFTILWRIFLSRLNNTAYSIYTKSSSCKLSRTIVYTRPSLKAVSGIWEGVDRSQTKGLTMNI